MTGTKTFHIGDILSVTTEALVSPRHIEGVYVILNWMTGDNLFTHQLPRANDECAPSLRAQFPDLAAVTFPSGLTTDDMSRDECGRVVAGWLADQVAQFGETRDVAPLAASDHTRIDPLTELQMMQPDAPVIVVEVPDEGGAA